MQTYSGKFVPINKEKYSGDWNKIWYRSLWELMTFKWCDSCPDIVKWSSEEFSIPYLCKTDNKMHRYFPDLKIQFKSGKTIIVEIKPSAQTKIPKRKHNGKNKQYLFEVLTFVKNTSKWHAADTYSKDRGFVFQIWTEQTLRSLGIKIL